MSYSLRQEVINFCYNIGETLKIQLNSDDLVDIMSNIVFNLNEFTYLIFSRQPFTKDHKAKYLVSLEEEPNLEKLYKVYIDEFGNIPTKNNIEAITSVLRFSKDRGLESWFGLNDTTLYKWKKLTTLMN